MKQNSRPLKEAALIVVIVWGQSLRKRSGVPFGQLVNEL